MTLKFPLWTADKSSMGDKHLTRGAFMIQWIGVIIAILGFAYNGVKDYQKGEIKLPVLQESEELTKTNHPIQYCLMAYDPNVDKVFYQHEDGKWYDYAPQQRRYASTTQVRQQY
jgi:hypothetical protein